MIQGGAADIMKRALVEGYEAGLPLPSLTVHDEIDGALGYEGAVKWQTVMCEVFSDRLKVPMRVDLEHGPNWGQLEVRV